MMCKSVILAKLFHFSMMIFSGLAIYAFTKRYFSRDIAFFASALFFLTPGIFTQATYAYIDLSWTFYAFLGFYAFVLWNFKADKRWLILSAVICAMAADTKYIAATCPFIIFSLLVIIGFFYKKEKALTLRSAVLFSIVAGVVMLPYYIRPYLYTGNPVYPFYIKYIAESGWCRPDGGFGIDKNILNFVISPWFLTYYPGSLFGGAESQIGPIYIAFLPGLFLIKKRDFHISLIILFSCIFFILWFFAFQAVRYLMPIIPFLAILVGYIVTNMQDVDKNLSRFIKSTLIFLLIFNFTLSLYYNKEEISFFARGADAKEYLAKENKTGKIFHFINKNTSADSKILLVNEIRTFYLDRSSIREDHYAIFDSYYNMSKAKIMTELKGKGITHILFGESTHHLSDEPYTGNSLKKLLKDRNFVSRYLDKITEVEYDYDISHKTKYKLYRIKT